MVEQAGCHYCARWNAEIGPIYPRTAEGAYAPLRRVDLGGDEMEKLALQRRVNFTPTFVLVDAGGHGAQPGSKDIPGRISSGGCWSGCSWKETDFGEVFGGDGGNRKIRRRG